MNPENKRKRLEFVKSQEDTLNCTECDRLVNIDHLDFLDGEEAVVTCTHCKKALRIAITRPIVIDVFELV